MLPVNFTINLVEIKINICCNFGSSMEYCKNYLSECPADINLVVTKEDITFERSKCKGKYSDRYLEVLAIYRKITNALIEHNIVLIHGSAACINKNCTLFAGPSGVGKSTHAALLKQYKPKNVTIINDDKPLIKVKDHSCEVFGTPWDGAHHINENTSAPLKNICFVKKGKSNKINEVSKNDALELLMPQVFKSEDSQKVKKTLDLIDKLIHNTKFYELNCTKDTTAAELSYKSLSK